MKLLMRTSLLAALVFAVATGFGNGLFSSTAQADPFVTVRIIIERIRALSNFDPASPWGADFYASVTIDGEELNNRDQHVEDQDDIFPDWEFSKQVDLAMGRISVTIEIRDYDGGLRGEDDHADINPNPGRNLNLTLNLNPCSIEGDLSGRCGTRLTSSGTEDDSAEIWFRIEEEGLPSAPGLRVRCLHDPLWPQANDTITFTANALDGALNPRLADTIELWVNERSGPTQTCSTAADCHVSRGPFESGDTVFYGCLVRHDNDEAWSGWRRVYIGSPTPSEGRAVPVIYTGPKSSRIDIVFIADRDNYSGPDDSQFLSDVRSVIQDGYYSEDLFLSNQDKLNFWIAMDMGDAEPDCDFDAPSNWDDAYTFADVGAILHTDSFRDCAPGGERLFSSEPFSLKTVLHETGHRPFGLADEYCCDGGYFQVDPYPNVYDEPEDCQADIANLRVLDLRLGGYKPGRAARTDSDCREFEEVIDWWFDEDWSVSDPNSDDLMVDGGTPRAADVRRIEWLFDECRSARC